MGRILRKGKENKQAVLYEVISEGTSEERVSARRRGETTDDRTKPPTAQVIQLPFKYNQSVEPARKVAEADDKPTSPDDDGKLKY